MPAFPDTLRIFPLAEVVLFPGTVVPLHVFEERYRKMVADSLEDDRHIGMVLIREGDPGGSPPLYEVGCAGRIVKHDPLPDGRSLIVLEGTVKYRIRRELDAGEPYRVVEPQALHEAPVPIEIMREWRDELRKRVGDYVEAATGDAERVDEMFKGVELERIVNYLSVALPLDVVEKQSLLECVGPEQRHERLCEIVDFKVAEARLGLDSARDVDA